MFIQLQSLTFTGILVFDSQPASYAVSLCPPHCAHRSLGIHFGSDCCFVPDASRIDTGLQLLGDNDIIECWSADSSRTWRLSVKPGNTKVVQTEDWLLVAVWLSDKDCEEMAQATERAYATMLELAREAHMPHVVRSWNYLPHINRGDGDSETYKQFCAGRAAAYQEKGIAQADFASASALGTHSANAIFYQLSTPVRGQHFENPLQVSAYDYPRQYGPRSPTFARATACQLGENNVLFISGTASVKGHQSVHIGEIHQQTQQTLANLDALLSDIGTKLAARITPDFLKVYIRHPSDFPLVRDLVEARFPQCEFVYVAADICRADLLVEIDGHCWL